MMTHCRIHAAVAAIACALALAPSAAHAQSNPTFKYGDQKEVKEVKDVEWKVSAQAGMIHTTGNSRATTLSGGLVSSRKTGNNKFLFTANGAYARSTLVLVEDVNLDGVIQDDEIAEYRQTTTRSWELRARYDRFLTTHNSLYVTGVIGADKPAGKELVGAGQVGYSRQLFKDDEHELVGEVGYDLGFEDLAVDDGVTIHSLRAFLGYTSKLTADTGFIGSVETLANLNSLGPDAEPLAEPLEDTRINAGAAITTKIYQNISLRFGVTAKYDNVPATNPITTRPAEKLDTKTEAVLVVNFL